MDETTRALKLLHFIPTLDLSLRADPFPVGEGGATGNTAGSQDGSERVG